VTEFGGYIFNNNPLTSITIGADLYLEHYDAIFSSANFEDYYISNGRQTGTYTLNNGVWSFSSPFTFENGTITGYSGTEKALVIPSQIQGQAVTAIGDNAFRVPVVDGFEDAGLTSVVIPNSVTTIGDSAFYNNNLTSVTIPDSVTTIGNYAFYNNPMTSITIGANVELGGEDYWQTDYKEFIAAYYNNGRRAGMYTKNNGAWSFSGGQAALSFYVGYVHDTDMNKLAGRSRIRYGSGGETVIIYSNVDLYDFKIFNKWEDYLNGDFNFTCDVLITSDYLEYKTNIPEGMPGEGIHFKTADGKEHDYLLRYSGMDGTVFASRVEG